MSRASQWLTALSLSLLIAGTARAQQPDTRRLTVGASFGGLSGAANLDNPGAVDWRLGWAASANATYWVQRYVGLRASGTWGQDSVRGNPGSVPGRQKFNKFYYGGDIVLRYPLQAGGNLVTPYILGGAGAVSYHQLGTDGTFTKFAGDFGAGIEYRFGRFGVRAEGRDLVSTFDRFGFDKTQHDIVWDVGLTYSF